MVPKPYSTIDRLGVAFTSVRKMSSSDDDDVLNRAIEMLSGGGGGPLEAPEMTQARIQTLVNENPILLFMKGSKNFPQCGFSDTATKILEAYNINQVSCSGCTQ